MNPSRPLPIATVTAEPAPQPLFSTPGTTLHLFKLR